MNHYKCAEGLPLPRSRPLLGDALARRVGEMLGHLERHGRLRVAGCRVRGGVVSIDMSYEMGDRCCLASVAVAACTSGSLVVDLEMGDDWDTRIVGSVLDGAEFLAAAIRGMTRTASETG